MLALSSLSGHGSVDLAAGPVLWLAHGAWWPSRYHAYGGVRIAAGADQRLGRRFGLRVEAGLTPMLLDRTLWWFSAPADVRIGMSVWLGRPRSGPLVSADGG
jgi:hypothetical protein